MANVLLIAGEPSGEEHAMSFLPELLKERADIKLWGVGGDLLAEKGMELCYHLKDFSTMGFSEVVGKISYYKKALNFLTNEAVKRNTRDAILIDFQDFNLRLAQRLSKKGIRVWYYVAPQAWAWRPWRAKTLSLCTYKLFTILPFEEKWFRERGVSQQVSVPHPLTKSWGQQISNLKPSPWSKRLLSEPRLIVLPGSRRSEVGPLLPLFVETIKILKTHFPEMKVTLSRVPHLNPELYECALDVVDKWILPEELPRYLLESDAALAASGTVTMGTGLLGVPTVVAYQSGLLNEFIIRKIINYQKAVSLTNLILNKMVFPEYLQQQAHPSLMSQPIINWWRNPVEWEKIKKDLSVLTELLSQGEKSVGEMMAKEMKE
jgi:lipid-A-disaccharide synthase